MVKDREADPDQFLDDVAALIGERVTVTHSSSNGLVEIGMVGVTKASGLAYVAEQHGIDASEVAVVGDMPNDLPMLAWAGHPYAVANAHPRVLELAQHHLPSNDEDGVAQLIEQLLRQSQLGGFLARAESRSDAEGERGALARCHRGYKYWPVPLWPSP